MARYFRQIIVGLSEPLEQDPASLEGLQPLARSAWVAPMRGQDRVVAIGRRVLAETSVGPATDWRFISGAPSSISSTGDFMRHLSRLSPGCMPRLSVLHLPSGGVGGNTTTPDEAGGVIRLSLTWTAADATVESHDIDVQLPASLNEDFDALSGAGEAFEELHVYETTLLPPVDLSDAVENTRWSAPGGTVEIHAVMRGAPRVVDFCVFETPFRVAYEADDAEWCSHVYATGDAGGPSDAAGNRPRERRNETSPDGNPRGGTDQTLEVARAQRRYLGPLLAYWNHYQEATSDASTGLVGLVTAGSASNLVCLMDSTLTAYDETREGLSVSSGGYARSWQDNNGQILGTEDAAAAIPVVFRVYGNTTSGSSVEMRFMTGESSWVSLTLTTTEGWHEGFGFLTVGLNASDPTVGQVFINGNQTVSVHALTVEAYRA